MKTFTMSENWSILAAVIEGAELLPDAKNVNHALKELERLSQQREPFFLAVGLHSPHLPFRSPKSEWDKDSLHFKIPDGKRAIGDPSYGAKHTKDKCSVNHIGSKNQDREFKKFMARCKSRQESFHGRLNYFNILEARFRHGKKNAQVKKDLRKACTEAVVVLTQYDIENGFPLMEPYIFKE